MQSVITDLVTRLDAGTLTRRRLLQGLTLLAAAGGAGRGAAQDTPFKSTIIDHISVQVPDLAPSIEFYERVFGLAILNEDKANEIVRMGVTKTIVSLHHKEPTRIVDHFAIAVEGFERESATRALERHGLKAEQNLDYGFHVRDPAGIPVQIVGA
jgi:catechol 2,3-dioxygenase-like lactoylglutathione lyase family enzyme